jgi:hypothetical protein
LHLLRLQGGDIGRCKIIRHYNARDRFAIVAAINRGDFLLKQNAQYAVHNVIDIVLAGAEVGIIHFLKHMHQGITLLFERPFRIALLFTNDLHRRACDGGVFQHQ